MKPWTIVPAFKEARLVKLAKILVRIRNQAAALQQPQRGDTAWSLGVRVYARTTIQLTRLSGKQLLPWLSAHLVFNTFFVKIGGVPIHIFRGDANDPDAKQLQRGREKAPVQESHITLGVIPIFISSSSEL